MGVGSGLYMCDVVVKKVHVRYLISWWVLVLITFSFYTVQHKLFLFLPREAILVRYICYGPRSVRPSVRPSACLSVTIMSLY